MFELYVVSAIVLVAMTILNVVVMNLLKVEDVE